ncbi:MAG: twin-arginine translocase subunit TatC [Actinomycetia bacterium]|nr:twin-arginine translocase subunit TatC [Actinomycetes bacterium]
MPLMEHLRELRTRIFKALIAVVVGGVVGWLLYEPIFNFIVGPIESVAEELRQDGFDIRITLASVASPFTLQLKIAAMTGIVLASPVWIYQLWAFVTPGLHRHERRYGYAFLFTAVPLFLAGVAAALWVLPKGLELLLGFTPEGVSNFLAVDAYLSFLVRTMIVFGIGFLLPVFIVGLNLVGILSANAIRRSWRWTILGVFLFGAIATPTGDPLSMMLLAGPMLVLMLVAFGICLLNERRRARRSTEPDYTDLDDDEASPMSGPDGLGEASPIDAAEPITDPDDLDHPGRTDNPTS